MHNHLFTSRGRPQQCLRHPDDATLYMQLYSSNDSKQKIKRDNHRHTKKTNKLTNSAKTPYMTVNSSQYLYPPVLENDAKFVML